MESFSGLFFWRNGRENENSFRLWAKKYPWFWILGKEWLSKDLNLNSKFEVFNFWYEKSFQDYYIYILLCFNISNDGIEIKNVIHGNIDFEIYWKIKIEAIF